MSVVAEGGGKYPSGMGRARARSIPTPVREALSRYRQKLEARFPGRLADLRLHGSYARGDFHDQSDVDVLVLVRDLHFPEDREAASLAFDVENEIDFALAISPLVRSPEGYRELIDRERLIALDIERDGIAV